LTSNDSIDSTRAIELARQALAKRGYTYPIYKIHASILSSAERPRSRSLGIGPRPSCWVVYVEFDTREMIQQGKAAFGVQGDYHIFVDVEMDGTVNILEYPDVPEDRIIFPEDE